MATSRRRLIGGVTGAAVLSGGFPTIWAQNIRNITLRQICNGVSASNIIAEQAKKDLGFTVTMTGLDADTLVQRTITQPRGFDIVDVDYYGMKKIVPAGTIHVLDTKRIKNFERIVPLFKTGKLTPASPIAQGTAPHTVMYVTGPDSKTFAPSETQWAMLVPSMYNADTLGIRPDLTGRPITSWKDLADRAFKGRTAIVNIPSVGIMDAAMVMEALGEIQYADKGNMTRAEIDKTIAFLIARKREGHFRAFWKSFDESVNLMAAGEVVIQSMWSPAVAAVRSRGIPCVYQPLKEGYRAWGMGLGIAKHQTGLQLDAAYEYLNWYISGWVGAYLNRQGYYAAVLDNAKTFMTDNEWGFWMEGKPAVSDILSPEGKVMEKAGTIRDGGSFAARMGNIACWNSVMAEDRYLIQKWNEFAVA